MDNSVYVDDNKATMRRTQYDKLVAKLQLQEATIADLTAQPQPETGEAVHYDIFVDAERKIRGLIESNAKHRKGFRLQEVTDEFVLSQAADEMRELQDDPNDIRELADLFGVLIHYAIRKRWPLLEIELALIRKLDERFNVYASDTTQTEPPAPSQPTEAKSELLPCPFGLSRIEQWLKDGCKQPTELAFTAGEERSLADWILVTITREANARNAALSNLISEKNETMRKAYTEQAKLTDENATLRQQVEELQTSITNMTRRYDERGRIVELAQIWDDRRENGTIDELREAVSGLHHGLYGYAKREISRNEAELANREAVKP